MGLLRRVSDIISANLTEIVSRFENPEKMLRQAVEEMEKSVQDAAQLTAKAMANQKKLAKELAHNEQQVAIWQARAEKASSAGDDALARRALTRKQEHEKLVLALREHTSAAAKACRTLQKQMENMNTKLSEAKRNFATLSVRNRAAAVSKQLLTGKSEVGVSVDARAFANFDRLRQKVEQAEAEAEALAELRLIESRQSSRDVHEENSLPMVDWELAELKRLNGKPLSSTSVA